MGDRGSAKVAEMIRPAILALALLTGQAAAQSQAPFCVVDAAGTRCMYYSLPACRQSAGPNGACIVNSQRDPAPTASQPNFWDNAARSYEAGRRARNDRSSANWRQFCQDMQAQDIADLDRMPFATQNDIDEYSRRMDVYAARSQRCFSLAGSR